MRVYQLDRVRHHIVDAAAALCDLADNASDPEAIWEIVRVLRKLEAKVAALDPHSPP